MAQLINLTKSQLVTLFVTELNVETDDEARKLVALARKARQRRQLERQLVAAQTKAEQDEQANGAAIAALRAQWQALQVTDTD